jgi:hypothetical protein
MLASCNSFAATPTMSDAELMETAISNVSIALAETQRAIPTNTPLPVFSSPTTTLTSTASAAPSPTLMPGLTATPIFPPIESFIGIWLNLDANTNQENWTKIKITENEGTLSAYFQLICTSTDQSILSLYPDGVVCADGGASAKYSGNPVLLSIEYESTTRNYTLSLNGDTLHVTTLTHFTDNSGKADKTSEADFRRDVISFPLSEQIAFYHFRDGPCVHCRIPRGSVSTPIDLFPGFSVEPYTSDTAADLRTALGIVLQHEANGWVSSDLEIVDVTFRDGHADIVLQGEYSGEREDVLNAARIQILLTVFSNPSVQSAAVTLNEDTIGNLGVSSSADASPADYVYTRAEMELYLQEHAYMYP